jgi:uncharacterized protein
MPLALVTGASAGIGRQIAKVLAEKGYDICLTARNLEPLNELSQEIRKKFNRKTWVFISDLSIPGAPADLVAAMGELTDQVEVLINNAGFGLLGPFADLDADDQMAMVNLNVGALTQLSRLLLPSLLARGKGYILNVASTAAFQPGPLMAVYYATKAYVVSFSAAVHNEVRSRGVSITALCPGPTLTEFQKRAGMANTPLFTGRNTMSAEAVARIGVRAMFRRKPLVVAGRLNAAMAFLTRFAPRQLAASMVRRVQEVK